MIKKTLLAALLGAAGFVHADVIVNFDDLSLAPNSYHNTSTFQSSGVSFNNFYQTTPWTSWAGFAYSNVTDHTTGGFGNQFASAAPSTGIYAIAYVDSFNEVTPTISLPLNASQPISISLTNTAYAYNTIKNGDSFTEPFAEGSWFLLTIEAKDALNQSLGTVELYLADYRSANEADWFVLNTWETVDLSSFGSNVATLNFDLTSSDTGINGMNTPAYFAMDNLVAIPEPGVYALLALGFVTILWRTRTSRISA
jgi:hypothetical protein